MHPQHDILSTLRVHNILYHGLLCSRQEAKQAAFHASFPGCLLSYQATHLSQTSGYEEQKERNTPELAVTLKEEGKVIPY